MTDTRRVTRDDSKNESGTDGGTGYYDNTSELAEGIVEQWTNSPGTARTFFDAVNSLLFADADENQ